MTPLELLSAVAERQHLLVATWQATAVGVHNDAILERIDRQGWRRWQQGVVALPGPTTAIRRAAAAVLAYSKPRSALKRLPRSRNDKALVEAVVATAWNAGQLLWGPSALWLHGLLSEPADTWIRLPARSGHIARDGVRLRFGGLPKQMTRRVNGFWVPVVEQAILEYATLSQRTKLHDVIASAVAKRLTTLDRLERHLNRVGAVTGARTLRRAIAELRGELSHSRTERKGRRIVIEVARQYGLVAGSRPLTVMLGGRRAGEADVPIEELLLDIEIDGPHHKMPAQQAIDIQRDRLMRRAGWIVERFSTDLIDKSPESFRAQVDEAIRAALSLRAAGARN